MFLLRLQQCLAFVAQWCQRSSEDSETLDAAALADSSKSRLKKDFSVAKWDAASGTAKVVTKRGKMLNTTGITRDGLLVCHVEEAVFLAEHGFLLLTVEDRPLGLHQVYELLSSSNEHGCSWDAYQVYSYFKRLGYIVGRHGVHWSTKQQAAGRSNEVTSSLKPTFDIYSPNTRFKKTCPGKPCFSICVISAEPPSSDQATRLQEANGETLVRFATVEGGHVGIFSFSQVRVPFLA